MNVALVRVNDGRVLGEVKRTVRASGKSEDEAAAGVTIKAFGDATRELVANSAGIRDREGMDKTKFSLKRFCWTT